MFADMVPPCASFCSSIMALSGTISSPFSPPVGRELVQRQNRDTTLGEVLGIENNHVAAPANPDRGHQQPFNPRLGGQPTDCLGESFPPFCLQLAPRFIDQLLAGHAELAPH